MQVVPVVPWSIARIIRGENLSGAARAKPARRVDTHERGQLPGTVHEAGRRAPGGAMLEVELDLLQPRTCAHGVGGHRDLDAETRGERHKLREQLAAQRSLARYGGAQLRAGQVA